MDYLFTYNDSAATFPEHAKRNGQHCVVTLELGDDERDAEVGPMYWVQFPDEAELCVFGYELTPHPPITNLDLVDGDWESTATS